MSLGPFFFWEKIFPNHFLVFVVEPDQEAKDEAEWSLERAVVGKGGGGTMRE